MVARLAPASFRARPAGPAKSKGRPKRRKQPKQAPTKRTGYFGLYAVFYAVFSNNSPFSVLLPRRFCSSPHGVHTLLNFNTPARHCKITIGYNAPRKPGRTLRQKCLKGRFFSSASRHFSRQGFIRLYPAGKAGRGHSPRPPAGRRFWLRFFYFGASYFLLRCSSAGGFFW